MPTPGNDQHITLAEAAELTKNYRQAQSAPGFILGEYFEKGIINEILEQQNCTGIRIYHAMKQGDTGEMVPCFVITGVTGTGDNIEDFYEGVLAEKGTPCPPTCSTNNPLNSDQ